MRRSSLVILYLTVFIDLLGFGIVLPMLPFYAEHFGASGIWIGAMMSAYSVAQLIGAPLLGRLSDRHGRRPVLLISLAGSALSLTASGFASTLGALIAARAFAGLFGGSISTAQAYIADVTEPKDRTRYMGFLGASIGLGFVFGPALGSGLSRYGFGAAAFVAAGLAAANFLFAAVKLQESRRPGVASLRPRLSAASLFRALRTPIIGRIVAGMFLSTLAFVAMEATFALLGERSFGLNPERLGLVFTYIGVIIAIVQGGFVGRLAHRFGERNLAIAGQLTMAAAFCVLPFTSTLVGALVALGILSVGQALTTPSVTSLLSKSTPADEQGGTLGLGASSAAAARAIGPIAAGFAFDYSPALPYLFGAALLGVAALLLTSLRGVVPEPVMEVEPSDADTVIAA